MLSGHPLLIYAVGYFGWFAYGLCRFRRAPGDEIVQVALALIWPITVTVYVVYLIGCWIDYSARVRAERGGVTLDAPTTGFRPSTGGSAVVKSIWAKTS